MKSRFTIALLILFPIGCSQQRSASAPDHRWYPTHFQIEWAVNSMDRLLEIANRVAAEEHAKFDAKKYGATLLLPAQAELGISHVRILRNADRYVGQVEYIFTLYGKTDGGDNAKLFPIVMNCQPDFFKFAIDLPTGDVIGIHNSVDSIYGLDEADATRQARSTQ